MSKKCQVFDSASFIKYIYHSRLVSEFSKKSKIDPPNVHVHVHVQV
jgi:hypothetical protein